MTYNLTVSRLTPSVPIASALSGDSSTSNEGIEICWLKTASHRVVFLHGNTHGCGDRLTSKEFTMGPETLFPMGDIFYFGCDDDFWQRFSPYYLVNALIVVRR